MHRSRSLSAILLATFALQATGCRSFQPLQSTLPSTAEAAAKDPRIRVTTEDDGTWAQWDLTWVYADSLTLVGQPRLAASGGRTVDWVTVPRSEILTIEERRFDLRRTLIVSGAAVVALTLITWAIGDAIAGDLSGGSGDWGWG